jgi:hypothetical protein
VSRENRRRSTAPATAPAGPATAPAPRRDDTEEARDPRAGFAMPRVSLRAVFIGLLVGQFLLLLLTNGSVDAANAAFGSSGDRIDGGIVGTTSFIAVITGGFVAARSAGYGGVWQGTMVGIGFIVIAIGFDFAVEAKIVHDSFTINGGPRSLVDLGPMRIDQVITGDLLALFGGSVGGYLARRR